MSPALSSLTVIYLAIRSLIIASLIVAFSVVRLITIPVSVDEAPMIADLIVAARAESSLKSALSATILPAVISFDCRYSKYPFSPYKSVTLIIFALSSFKEIELSASIPANSLLIIWETPFLNAPLAMSFWIRPAVRVIPSLFRKLLDEPDAEDLLPPELRSRRYDKSSRPLFP